MPKTEEPKQPSVSDEYCALLDKKPDTSYLTADTIRGGNAEEITAEQQKEFVRALFFGKPSRANEEKDGGGGSGGKRLRGGRGRRRDVEGKRLWA